MTWNSISTQADADKLLELFGDFHDGCIREAHMWTEDYVSTNLCMSCSSDLGSRVRLLIQRQFRDPSAIELLFEGVSTFHFQPIPVGYGPGIFDATIIHEDETFYWADDFRWSPLSEDCNKVTWVAAKKLSWRDASDWMGPELRYRSADNS